MDWKLYNKSTRGGHKVLCKIAPKVIQRAEGQINSFRLQDYTVRNVGTFMVSEAEAQRGKIDEEDSAQYKCYDAMELTKRSPQKLLTILDALDIFPLSTEAWSMLGSFYEREVKPHEIETKECSTVALKMYETSIKCARILNPTWTEDRNDELTWGQIENRPYLRALNYSAMALLNLGRVGDAIRRAEMLLRLNPNDNQGTRKLLCGWYLQNNDIEGCTNHLRKYGVKGDTSLAYTNVLLQFMRWKNDDVAETDVQKALFHAVQENTFVPDLITADAFEDVIHDFYTPGHMNEAEMYFTFARKLWEMHPDAIEWLKSQKYDWGKDPTKDDTSLSLPQSKTTSQKHCVRTDWDGKNSHQSVVIGSQKKQKYHRLAFTDFIYPCKWTTSFGHPLIFLLIIMVTMMVLINVLFGKVGVGQSINKSLLYHFGEF